MGKTIVTKSINLWLIDANDNKITLTIPFANIYVLELENITTTVGHNSKGEFMEFLICNNLNLKLYKEKLTDEEYTALYSHDILSITLNFNNNTSKSYNVIWKFVNNRNSLQVVDEDQTILKIFIG